MRTVLQSEASECGLACLAMVADHHGLRVDLAALRRRFSISLKGATLASIASHAHALGFTSRALRLELDELGALATPCLLHWDLNHFVVLERAGNGRIRVHDPAIGRRDLALDEAGRHFTGVALELLPTPQFRRKDERRKIRLRELLGDVRGLGPALVQVLLLAAALEVFALCAPLFNQFVIDDVIASGDADLLPSLLVGFMLLLATQTAIGVARAWVVMRLSMGVRLQWTSMLFAHALRLPPEFFAKRHLGDIVSRFGSVSAIQRTLTTSAVGAVLDNVMAVASLAICLVYSPTLTLIVAGASLLYVTLRVVLYRPFLAATSERIVLAAREQTHFLESLRAVVPIKLSGHEAARIGGWQNLMVDVFNRDVSTQKLEIVYTSARTFIFGGASLLVLFFGARLVMEAAMTIGMLMAFASYASTFGTRVASLVGFVVEFRMLGLHAERIADIALATQEEVEAHGDAPLDLVPALSIRGAAFRYAEGEPHVFENVDVEVAAGESLAIVGPSGCGKSTLLKIALGLMAPTRGEVRLGGVPLRRIGLARYRRMVAAVMQDDTLLRGSLLDNIAFFDPNPDAAWARECAMTASVHDEIEAMPMGYQTLVGDMGTSLSGGQKQRVLLARALYRRPKLLVLDEATSHLDGENEKRINRALASLRITRLVVAHRAETIASADSVLLLTRGGSIAPVRASSGVEGSAAACHAPPPLVAQTG